MLFFNQLQTLLGGRNVFLIELDVVRLEPLLRQPIAVSRQFTLGGTDFFLHVANRIDQPLSRTLGHIQTADLVGDLDTQPANLAAQAGEFPGFLAARNFCFGAELGPFLQSVLEKLIDILDAFDGPNAILIGLVFLAGEFRLLRKSDDLANAHLSGRQLFAHFYQLADGDRRSGNSFLSLDLAALDPLRDGDFTFASQQRHHAHLAQIQPHRIVGLLQGSGGKIQFQIVVAFFIVGGDGRRLLDQALVGIGHMNVRRVQFLKYVFDIVRRYDILRQFAIQIVVRQKFFVSAQLQQSIHYVVSIFFFNSHDYFSCYISSPF